MCDTVIYHDYMSVCTKTGREVQFPVLTTQHMKWCEEGYINILDLKNNRDCIGGEWVHNETKER